MNYSGIDLHSNNSVVSVIDETDHVVAEKRLPNDLAKIMDVLAVENITARQCGTQITSNQIKQLDQATVDQLHLPDDVALAVRANVAVIMTLSAQIAIVEKRLQEQVAPCPDYALLTSVPGIGRTLATVIVLETGTIDRFTSAGNFASYARCVDSQRMSNGKKKGEGNTRNGNPYLCRAFIEAVSFAMHFSAEARQFYERKKARTNPVIARKALAHKLARACFHMLKDRKPFDVTRCFA